MDLIFTTMTKWGVPQMSHPITMTTRPSTCMSVDRILGPTCKCIISLTLPQTLRLRSGPFLYTLSGTMGGTTAAVGRGLPGIAFSGGNGDQRSYTWINATTPSGYPDPATIQGQLAVKLVNKLIKGTPAGKRLLPLGYGLK